MTLNPSWYRLHNEAQIETPSILIAPEVVEHNVRQMIALAGDPERLWPHVKTHKLAQITRLQVSLGIVHFKCATLAEAWMCAEAGAKRVLVAMSLTGRNAAALLEFAAHFPATRFACLADSPEAIADQSRLAQAAGRELEVFLDLDCGMRRSGVAPGPQALDLYRRLIGTPGLVAAGLHAYDGHIDGGTRAERTAVVDQAHAGVRALRQALAEAGLAVPLVIAGGSPSFPIHAQDPSVALSPGSTVLWMTGLAESCHDMEQFAFSAMLMARVLSRPANNRLTLELGHKALASDMPLARRASFPQIPDAVIVMQSEEHLVIESELAANFPPGSVIYAHPTHICPNIALHASVVVVREQQGVMRWKVTARDRWTAMPDS